MTKDVAKVSTTDNKFVLVWLKESYGDSHVFSKNLRSWFEAGYGAVVGNAPLQLQHYSRRYTDLSQVTSTPAASDDDTYHHPPHQCHCWFIIVRNNHHGRIPKYIFLLLSFLEMSYHSSRKTDLSQVTSTPAASDDDTVIIIKVWSSSCYFFIHHMRLLSLRQKI